MEFGKLVFVIDAVAVCWDVDINVAVVEPVYEHEDVLHAEKSDSYILTDIARNQNAVFTVVGVARAVTFFEEIGYFANFLTFS